MRASFSTVKRTAPGFGPSLARVFRLGAALWLVASLSGCLGRSPEVTHFVLGGAFGKAAVSGATAGQAGLAPDAAVLVGPVALPAYLQRPQLASQGQAGEVELAEFERWMGGFERNFLRAIALDLADRLGSVKVVAAPSQAPFPIDYRVRIHVDDLIASSDGRLVTRIRWALIPAKGHGSAGTAGQKAPASLFLLEETVPIVGDSAAAIVEAHEAVVTDLSARIAEAIAQ